MITRRFVACLAAATCAAAAGAAAWGTAASAVYRRPTAILVCAEMRSDIQNMQQARDASTDPSEINRLNDEIADTEFVYQTLC